VPGASERVADDSRRVLGGFIRARRQMANLSLRQLSALSEVSNPYLSQVERGLHAPSVRVLRSIAQALDLSAETLLEQAGLVADADRLSQGELPDPTECAIRADRRLTSSQRRALLTVYRSYVDDTTDAES
jgi:transcriptional regulator with XRE-family HTH domain